MNDLDISPSDAVTPARAAQLCGRHRTTIVRAIESGELKAVRRNNRWWSIQLSDLEAWHGSSVATATPGPEARLSQRIEDLESLLSSERSERLSAVEHGMAANDRADALRALLETEQGRVRQLTADLSAARADNDRLAREREAAVTGQSTAMEAISKLTSQIEARDAVVAEKDGKLAALGEELAEARKVASTRTAEIKALRSRTWWARLLNR